MTTGLDQENRWPRKRWWVTIAFVLGVQVLLIDLLENRSPAGPRKISPVPLVRIRNEVNLASLPVNDPTLFVLPHHEGFSGAAWLDQTFPLEFHAADWTEPLRWLDLTAATLGASFQQFIAANAPRPFENIITAPAPALAPGLFPIEILPATSTLQIGGELAGRQLISPPQLQAWTNSSLLTNSIVQVLVNAKGDMLSATLRQSCGFAPADARALDIARDARFEAAKNPDAGFALGALTFDWQTVPPPSTNPPPGNL